MKKFLEYVGFLLIIQGAAGLIYYFVGWFRLWTIVHYIRFLAGYEIVANVSLMVLGVVVMLAADRIAAGAPRR
jgi:hypothetical protein